MYTERVANILSVDTAGRVTVLLLCVDAVGSVLAILLSVDAAGRVLVILLSPDAAGWVLVIPAIVVIISCCYTVSEACRQVVPAQVVGWC